MDPVTISALIAGGASLIGSGLSTWGSFRGMKKSEKIAEKNIQMQEEINQQNINFAEKEANIMRMREDNAIQRQAQDLQMAGLNPAMAGNLGGAGAAGAGTPTLQAPQIDTSIGSAFAQNLGQGINTGVNGIQSMGNLIQKALETKLKKDLGETELNIKAELAGLEKEKLDETKNMNTKIREEIDARINNTKAATETQKTQAKLIYEKILSEPVQRNLAKAQKALFEEQSKKTREEKLMIAEKTKEIQENTKLLSEEKQESIAKQCLILAEIGLKESQIEKIAEEVNILIHEGNLKEFEDKIKEWDWGIEKGGQIASTVMDAIQLYFSGGLLKSGSSGKTNKKKR